MTVSTAVRSLKANEYGGAQVPGTTANRYSAAAFWPGLPTNPAGSPKRSIMTAVKSFALLVTQAPERTA